MNNYNYYPILINGEVFNCCSSMSLQDLLTYLNFDLNLVIIEYNQQIIDKENWQRVFPKINDSLEIITITGGG